MSYYEEFDYNKPMSLKVWAKMLPFIKPHGKQLAYCAALMTAVAGIDIAMPLLLGHAIDNYITPRVSDGIWPFLAVVTVMVILQGVGVKLFVSTALKVEMKIGRDLRDTVFTHLQKLSFSYYNQTPVGYMMARTHSDTSRIGELVAWGMVDFAWSLIYCLGAIVAMFIYDWRLALIVCATIPPLALITWFFQKKILVINRAVRKLNSKMTGAMNEGITGARTTKVLVTEEQSLKEFSAVTGDLKRRATRMIFMRSVFLPLVLFVGSLATAFVLGYGGYEVMFLGVELGVLTIFVQYAGSFFDPVQNIANILTEFVSTQANIERVTGMLEQTPDITDTPGVIEKYGDSFSPKRENWEPLIGEVEFKDVTFMYPDGKENVLEHFNLKVPAGSYIAIVGETGAGKSTLVNLVCRFFEPTQGQVLIDGRDCRERSQLWLHSALGYVLQSPHLFSGTVRENIRYGRLDATDEEVEAAAKIVSADKIIAKLEGGFDALVGEGGDRLSTGEKQLISFARAVLADPRIFVLDEATSSVDTETELLIQSASAHLLRGRTSFVIAHRLSTIRTADLILVVKDGKITERGTHKQLLRAKGHYYELYTRQFEEDAEKTVLGGA
ncbi:MAG: ABC transporter ATP-binding protein/permease [Oscillospiraceae bacterium]|jgi:ATP-binding cassette subfamily B protein|nr:ABC transporter ATP-binding protein/permease [Oscillospiraceae bacterium]